MARSPRVGVGLALAMCALVTAATHAAAGTTPEKCPAAPTCNATTNAKSIACMQALVKSNALLPLLTDSTLIGNGMGNYYQCTNNGHTFCTVELGDASGEFTLTSNSICLPPQCDTSDPFVRYFASLAQADQHQGPDGCTSGELVNNSKAFLTSCANVAAQNCTSKNCGPILSNEITHEALGGLVDYFGALVGLAQSFSGQLVYHCGDANYGVFGEDFGAVLMVIITVCFMLTIVAASRYIPPSKQPNTSVNGDNGGVYEDQDDEALIGTKGSTALVSPITTDAKPRPYFKSKAVQAFNFDKNGGALFEQSAKRTLTGLDGLKTISMLWIILAHTCLLSFTIGEARSKFPSAGMLDPNATYTTGDDSVTDFYYSLKEQFQANADKAVDTFFLVSFMLMGYTLIGRLRKGSQSLAKLPAQSAKFLFLRWLRLTPLYAFVIFFYMEVLPYLSDGPFWFKMVKETAVCRNYWWSNLLYINNFYPTAFHNTCMSWTWYLANDMQFFCIGLVFLYIYIRNRSAAYTMAAAGIIASSIGGYVTVYNHPSHLQDWYYDKPYMRISPVLIGLCLGTALKDTKLKDTKLSTGSSFALMTCSILIILVSIYGSYERFNDPKPTGVKNNWSPATYSAYETLGRVAFSFAVAVLITLGISKNGGFIYTFLSYSFWEPMGKLTYGAYLIHPIIIRGYYYQMTQLFDFGTFDYTIAAVGVAGLSYSLSMVLHLTVELPFANLIRLIM